MDVEKEHSPIREMDILKVDKGKIWEVGKVCEPVYCGGGTLSEGDGWGGIGRRGTSLRGLFNDSSVTPSLSLVIPTTGGSPFLTNSYRPTHSDCQSVRLPTNNGGLFLRTYRAFYDPPTGTPLSQPSRASRPSIQTQSD